MIKRFFKNLVQGFGTYLLAAANLVHAITHKSYDWLLWCSLALVALSLILAAISAIRGGKADAET